MSIDTAPTLDEKAIRASRRAERLLIPAGFITTTGNAFQITAAAILVFRAEETTLSVGWLFIAVSIPQVALAVIFGRLADRFDRKTLCVLADVVSAITAFALPVWLWIGGPTNLGSYLANFLLACTAALFTPASNALIKERVPDERLGLFNSRFEMATNSGMLLAASSAGFLVVAFGATPLFVFNSGSFLLSAVLTYLIGSKPPRASVATGGEAAATGGDDAVRPMSSLAGRPIKRLALLYTSGNVNLMVSNVILTALILETFHQSAWVIGVVDALAGVGFIIGAACYPWISQRIGGLQLALFGAIGCMTMVIFEPLHYLVLMAVIPIAGFCFAQGRIAARTLLMQASPEDRVGRIFGGAQAFGLALGVAGTIGLSSLADAVSVPVAFWALVVLIIGIVSLTYASLVKPMAALAKEKESQTRVVEPAAEPATASA